VFNTKFVGVIMMRLRTKFQMLSSSGSFVIAIKLNNIHRFHATAMLFCILQKKLPERKLLIFWISVTVRHFNTLN